jgi:hypothetical protein
VGKFASVQGSKLYKRVVDMGIHSLKQKVTDRRKSTTLFGRLCPNGSLDIPPKQQRGEEEQIRN